MSIKLQTGTALNDNGLVLIPQFKTAGELLNQIHDEIDDTSLEYTREISYAFSEALHKYQSEDFYFLEQRSAIFYSKPDINIYDQKNNPQIALASKINVGFIHNNSQKLRLDRLDPIELESYDDKDTGMPYAYSLLNQSLKLYPTPDARYKIQLMVSGARLPDLAKGDEANIWISDAYILLKEATKAIFYRNFQKDTTQARVASDSEAAAFQALIIKTSKRRNYFKLKTSYF